MSSSEGVARDGKGGRPRCVVSPNEVRDLRDTGMSWRQIKRVLGIGTATAMRLYHAEPKASASQNPQVEI